MATCDLGYDHEDPAPAIPEPVVVPPPTSDNDVRIAEIQAEAEVELAEVRATTEIAEAEVMNARLEGRLRGIEETLDRLAPPEPPEAEPVVVPIAPPPPPVAEESASPVPDVVSPRKGKDNSGWWAGYR